MSKPADFAGSNIVMRPPPGRDDVCPLPVFTNGFHCVSCWELSDEELGEIMRTGRVYVSLMTGGGAPQPVYPSSETGVRELIADQGVWKR